MSSSLPLVGHEHYSFPFPGSHRFPMQKFHLLERVLEEQGILGQQNHHRPEPVDEGYLALCHERGYIRAFCEGSLDRSAMRKLGLPWSEALVRRSLISPGGTLRTARLALEHGLACHLAGGTHHAHREEASGFCIFNDLALAAKTLVQEGLRVLIFDLDVHQGDGTARLLEGEQGCFTCSVHCRQNFPLKKAQSDLDVEVEAGTKDAAYLEIVQESLQTCLDQGPFDLVFYDAGVDVFVDDPLGKLEISLEGLRARERHVIETVRGAGLPLATVIGGGYDPDELALARRHAMVVEEAHRYHGS